MSKWRTASIIALVALSTVSISAGQTHTKKNASVKHSTAKTTSASSTRHEEHSAKRPYSELLISELNGEDPSRWTERMQSHASVSGFVTNIAKGEDGDVNVRICENPKVDGMDRNRCVVAKCIPEIPCDLPAVGKPITVKGITRYDAKAGAHWWEIHPVEQIEK